MFGIHHYGLFIATGILLNITPGQDTLYVLGRTISQGRRAGIISVLGISSGCLVHTFAAAFGLSAVLAASSGAFQIVKMAGAAYLIYLGLQMFFQRATAFNVPSMGKEPISSWKIYRQGVLINVLNPKVALFFMAFLPQFIDAASGMKVVAFVVLGLTFIFNGTIWCLLLVLFASAFSRRLRSHKCAGNWIKRAAGALFVGLGLRLALEKR